MQAVASRGLAARRSPPAATAASPSSPSPLLHVGQRWRPHIPGNGGNAVHIRSSSTGQHRRYAPHVVRAAMGEDGDGEVASGVTPSAAPVSPPAPEATGVVKQAARPATTAALLPPTRPPRAPSPRSPVPPRVATAPGSGSAVSAREAAALVAQHLSMVLFSAGALTASTSVAGALRRLCAQSSRRVEERGALVFAQQTHNNFPPQTHTTQTTRHTYIHKASTRRCGRPRSPAPRSAASLPRRTATRSCGCGARPRARCAS